MVLENRAKIELSDLENTLVAMIATSKTIGFYSVYETESPPRVLQFLDYGDKELAWFRLAVSQYDDLPVGHKTRQGAPYDLVHSSLADVEKYYRRKKNGLSPRAA